MGTNSTMITHRIRALPVLVALGAGLPAQDIIAVNFAGQAFALDSGTGTGTVLGATGRTGHNGMARSGRQVFVNEMQGSGTTAQHFLDVLDEATGTASRSVALTRDIRGLAPGGQFKLLGIAQSSPTDDLVSIDLFNGTITVVGSTGLASLQALTLANFTFYGWDLNVGLVRIDHVTGVATDVNPNVATNGATIQFLMTRSDGKVFGGQNALYEIDLVTGVPTLIGIGGYSDLRGAEERFGSIVKFGTGCAGISLGMTGTPSAGSSVTSTSTGHEKLRAGILILGVSNQKFGGTPLPLDMDPLLRTSGCSLLVSPDIIVNGTTSLGTMSFTLPIVNGNNGLVFHFQHAALHQAPGGLAFSNGVTLRIAM